MVWGRNLYQRCCAKDTQELTTWLQLTQLLVLCWWLTYVQVKGSLIMYAPTEPQNPKRERRIEKGLPPGWRTRNWYRCKAWIQRTGTPVRYYHIPKVTGSPRVVSVYTHAGDQIQVGQFKMLSKKQKEKKTVRACTFPLLSCWYFSTQHTTVGGVMDVEIIASDLWTLVRWWSRDGGDEGTCPRGRGKENED